MRSRSEWLIVMLVFSAAPARAQATGSVLDDLASPDYATRVKATASLIGDNSLTPQAIADLYAKAWTLEQKQRLSAVAQHHAIRLAVLDLAPAGGEGALGIRQQGYSAGQLPEVGQPAVAVVGTFPGFPAHAQLRVGDLILAVNERHFPLHMSATDVSHEFGQMVKNTRADQVLNLMVYRDGKRMAVRVRLSGLEALNQVYGQRLSASDPYRARWNQLRQALVDQDLFGPTLQVLPSALAGVDAN